MLIPCQRLLCRSMNTPHANLSSSRAFLLSSVKLVRAWLTDPFRKLNWWQKARAYFSWESLLGTRWMCIDFSKILLILHKREIGLSLLQSSLSPFSWIGITFAILIEYIFGNTPWLKETFISLKGFENSFLNSFKILVGIYTIWTTYFLCFHWTYGRTY